MKGSKKKKGKRVEKGDPNAEVNKRKAAEERVTKREAAEKERQRKWTEAWYRKLECQEKLDDIRCCMAEGLCMKPKTQSNVWINVVTDDNVQDVQLAFKRVPVPKPKPPPLPPLRRDLSSMIIDESELLMERAARRGGRGARMMMKKKSDDEQKEYVPYRDRFKCPYD